MSFSRSDRLSELVKKEVADIISNDIKDPRVPTFVSITDVVMSKDLKYAKVLISVLGEKDAQESAIKGLQSAAGYIRKELGKRLQIRYVPEVNFKLDNSIEYSAKIYGIINKINQKQDDGKDV